MGMKSALKVVMLMLVLAVGCKPDESNNDQDSHILNGHEYVDLGLPSGTLWATCNVGADAPEDYGDYYAWGDTLPKTMYDWKNYRYATFVDGHYELTKYCTDSTYGYNGFVDYKLVLDPVDDAAWANWGTGWRMPTKEDWAELFQNTTMTSISMNGVDGNLFTGCNGNSIFLPAAGYYEDGEFICTGVGIYWSSTLQTNYQLVAFSFHFTYEGGHVCGTYERRRGHAVRAVCSL